MPKSTVIIASRSREMAERLASFVSKRPDFKIQIRVLANGHADPLHGVQAPPDILLLHCGGSDTELEYLAEQGMGKPLPLIVCGPDGDTVTMRLAMQAGARDYLTESMPGSDLIDSLMRIHEESLRMRSGESGDLIVVVNGKGGSGASFVATNLAHSLVVDGDKSVTLIDLDLQFGGLCRYLDISPEIGILQALESVSEMDAMSADAYTCSHRSGLKLIAAQSSRPSLPRDISIERLDTLLQIYLSINDFVVVDSPARFDAATELCFERADRILIVIQQSLPHVHDAARLMQMLANEVAVQRERMTVIVNRFAKNASIEIGDIKKALRLDHLFTIPNHYKLAAESINTGVPVAELARGAALTKSIRTLQSALVESDTVADRNILKRALPGFLRR